MLDQVKSGLQKVSGRIRTSITKALIKAVYDTGEIQLVKLQGLDSEIFDRVERLNSYGLTTNPPLDSEVVMAEIGGSRDHLVALVVDSGAHRVSGLASGEVCMYCQHGQTITQKADGNTEHTATVHKFNNGGRGGARINDETIVTIVEDAAFIAWVAAVHTALVAVAGASIAPYSITNPPTTVTGKINSATSEVELPND